MIGQRRRSMHRAFLQNTSMCFTLRAVKGVQKIFQIFLWESRFKSQALLDEKARAVCIAHADLNPVRAKMAHTPEDSEHTSIKRRIEHVKAEKPETLKLAEFVGKPREPMPQGLPFHLKDYIELVDLTGRAIWAYNAGRLTAIAKRFCINFHPSYLYSSGVPQAWNFARVKL
ncbi:hypothetical protein SAMN02745866_00019 [Alteromonadaceae bacterium Bs31]|nr:hypothetical protein SAMN02745866_00019 [Alteromonadaceae bacterium Bs31]